MLEGDTEYVDKWEIAYTIFGFIKTLGKILHHKLLNKVN